MGQLFFVVDCDKVGYITGELVTKWMCCWIATCEYKLEYGEEGRHISMIRQQVGNVVILNDLRDGEKRRADETKHLFCCRNRSR